jgi:hypothetical protein
MLNSSKLQEVLALLHHEEVWRANPPVSSEAEQRAKELCDRVYAVLDGISGSAEAQAPSLKSLFESCIALNPPVGSKAEQHAKELCDRVYAVLDGNSDPYSPVEYACRLLAPVMPILANPREYERLFNKVAEERLRQKVHETIAGLSEKQVPFEVQEAILSGHLVLGSAYKRRTRRTQETARKLLLWFVVRSVSWRYHLRPTRNLGSANPYRAESGCSSVTQALDLFGLHEEESTIQTIYNQVDKAVQGYPGDLITYAGDVYDHTFQRIRELLDFFATNQSPLPKLAKPRHLRTPAVRHAPQKALADRDRCAQLAAEHVASPNELILGDRPPWRKRAN